MLVKGLWPDTFSRQYTYSQVQLLFQDGVLTLSEVKSTMRCLGKKLSGNLLGKLKLARKESVSRDF
jgi:hypothetical protein